MVAITSAAGILSLLDETSPQLLHHALSSLNSTISQTWPEVSTPENISKIESLYEEQNFQFRKLAALVLSKVYYHLGDFDESLAFALGAGEEFRFEDGLAVGGGDDFIETVVSQAIDKYIELRNQDDPSTAISTKSAAANGPTTRASVESLAPIVDRLFERCIKDKEYKQAIGIALESRRLEIVEKIFSVAHDSELLTYTLQAAVEIVQKLELRNKILRLLVKLFFSLPSPDYFSIIQCFIYLNDPNLASDLLLKLLSSSDSPLPADGGPSAEKNGVLIGYQIAFDLAEMATQEFLENVRARLAEGGAGQQGGEKRQEAGDVMEVDEKNNSTSYHIDTVRRILTGEESIKFYLEFLYRNNHSDLLILKNLKDALETRNSMYHSAISFTNAFAHAGTTSDKFLRENLDFLTRASKWTKFTATAALGVIHKGNLQQGMSILQTYLPDSPSTSSASDQFSKGGALFALGLVHANHGSGVLDYLVRMLNENKPTGGGEDGAADANDVLAHGAALGLGTAGMATGNEDVYEVLRDVLYLDSAVAGEATGYAMGLVMLGTGNQKIIDEMLHYAHETAHEKIIRGCSVGISFLLFGKQEEADEIIKKMIDDNDSIIRYGGVHTIAMAYAGTGSNKAIRQLLHLAVSDVNDDVRRAAVTALGFLLFRNPTQVPRIVQLLSESYNPHVRYGATLALGISCAGTGLEEAIELLEPLAKDPVDFVRQGACISLAMILVQQNDTLNSKTSSARKIFDKIVNDKHEDTMAKFGATLANGIIDAGGRNVTISLMNKSGGLNMSAIVGMSLFTQFWYWFPLAHFASLTFSPTAIIGLDKDLKIPKFDFVSNARPSLFAYPQPYKQPTKEAIEKVATAVLSTTAKANARAKTKEKEKAGDAMDTDAKGDEKPDATKPTEDASMKVDETKPATPEPSASTEPGGSKAGPASAKKPKKEEPAFEKLPNLSRVSPAQLQYISFPSEGRYVPVRPIAPPVSLQSTAPPSSSASATSGTPTTTTTAGTKSTAGLSQRAITTSSIPSGSVSRGTGGGILILLDREPDRPAEYLDLEVLKTDQPPVPPPDQPQTAAQQQQQQGAGAGAGAGGVDRDLLEGPIADPPESFEFPFEE